MPSAYTLPSYGLGVFSVSLIGDFNIAHWNKQSNYPLCTLNYILNGMPTSYSETRPKSKFFSLLIYAGYPIA